MPEPETSQKPPAQSYRVCTVHDLTRPEHERMRGMFHPDCHVCERIRIARVRMGLEPS